MNGVTVRKIDSATSNDSRGAIYEWKHEDGRQITVCVRKAGIKSGGHYHKGEDPSKNPEKLFVTLGKAKIKLKGLCPGAVIEEKLLEGGDMVIILPNIAHQLEILEDAIILEYRITHFDKSKPDTYPVEV